QGTLQMAASTYAAQRARALLINTAHRYGGRPRAAAYDDETAGSGGAGDGGAGGGGADGGGAGGGGGGGGGKAGVPPASDVAHAERSFFLSAHRALLEAFPRARTVQLHGFQDGSAPRNALIVSGVGEGADLEGLLASLRAALPDVEVRGYPDEIHKL